MGLCKILLGETLSRQKLTKPVLDLFVLERSLGKAVGTAGGYPGIDRCLALSLPGREPRKPEFG